MLLTIAQWELEMGGLGQFALIAVCTLLSIGCALAAVIIWDIRRQRRIEDRARTLRRLGHVSRRP